MARIPGLSREQAAPESQPFFDRNLETFGQVLNSTGLYAYCPPIQQGVAALGEGVRRSGLIPARLRCLLNVRVASRIGCPY